MRGLWVREADEAAAGKNPRNRRGCDTCYHGAHHAAEAALDHGWLQHHTDGGTTAQAPWRYLQMEGGAGKEGPKNARARRRPEGRGPLQQADPEGTLDKHPAEQVQV